MPPSSISRSLNALPPGAVLRDYVIESELGSGGFSIVYLARHHLKPEWLYVIKEFFPAELAVRARDDSGVRPRSSETESAFEDGLRRFTEEAEQLRKFRNERYIVSCQNYFEENGTAYLVMDYDNGLPLSEFLERREAAGQPFTEADLLAVVEPLLESLTVVHGAGVLHRDIKPRNIFVRRKDDITGRPAEPVLIDFGAAKQNYLERHSRSRAPYTPGYAAYEQISSEGDIGPWTDIYAIGALMWRMVAGGCPGNAGLLITDEAGGDRVWSPSPRASEMRSYALHRGRPDPMVSATELGAGRFSSHLLESIDKCLALFPEDRVRSCEGLRTLLDLSVQSDAIKASGRSQSAPSTDSRQKRTQNSTFVGLLFVSCILPVGFGIFMGAAIWLFFVLVGLPLLSLANEALVLLLNLLFRFEEPMSAQLSFSDDPVFVQIAFVLSLFLLIGWFRNWWQWPSKIENRIVSWYRGMLEGLPMDVQGSLWFWRTRSLSVVVGLVLAWTGIGILGSMN